MLQILPVDGIPTVLRGTSTHVPTSVVHVATVITTLFKEMCTDNDSFVQGKMRESRKTGARYWS